MERLGNRPVRGDQWEGEPLCGLAPLVRASTSQRRTRGQDTLVAIVPPHPTRPTVVAVCDGHSSSAAARTCASSIQHEVSERMIAAGPPPPREDMQGMLAYATLLRGILHNTFTNLNQRCLTERGGTTLTLAVVSGWLLTVANVGDSAAFLDNGVDMLEVTTSDRVGSNEGERERVRKAGGHLAPMDRTSRGPSEDVFGGRGPLRVWPQGMRIGLKNGRSLGDAPDGTCILAHPHIKQVLLPQSGARLILATDGLWDNLPMYSLARLSRASGTDACAATLTSVAASRMEAGSKPDDITVVVLDLMPNCLTDFLGLVATSRDSAGASEPLPAPTPSRGVSLAKVIGRLRAATHARRVKKGGQAQQDPPKWPTPASAMPAILVADRDMATSAAVTLRGGEPATRPVPSEAAAVAGVEVFRCDSANTAAPPKSGGKQAAGEQGAFRCDSAYAGVVLDSATLRKSLREGLLALAPTSPAAVRDMPRQKGFNTMLLVPQTGPFPII